MALPAPFPPLPQCGLLAKVLQVMKINASNWLSVI
jgi:hypothetical protein